MKLILVITALSLLTNSSTLAQETTKQLRLNVVEHKIDSLKALKSLLKKKTIEIDSQINYLTQIRNKINFQKTYSSKDLFGTVTTDIHMRLTNDKMSDKIRKQSKVLILDYLPERKSFMVKHNRQIGYLSDSWIEQTTEIIQYKRTKKARATGISFKPIVTTTLVAGSLRDQPSLLGNEIIQIPAGSKIIVHDSYQKPYFKVLFKDKIGYLSYGSIKLTKPLQAIVDKTRTKQVVRRTFSREYGQYQNAEAIIRTHCAQEWPDDFRMRAYCEEQQREGLKQLRKGRPSDISEIDFKTVRTKCAQEWQTDFRMRAYCEEQQFEAIRKLRRP